MPSPQIAVEDGATVPLGAWSGFSRTGLACDDSSEITLSIAEPRAGEAPTATIVFGTDPFPSSAIDPDRGYPIDDDEGTAGCRMQRPSAGFVYEVLDGRIGRSGRVTFRVAMTEPFAPWCALQSSRPTDAIANGYWCFPGSNDDLAQCFNLPNPYCLVDRAKALLCSSGACVCAADGCRANLNRTLAFDLQVRGNDMEGFISLLWEQAPIEARLRRAE